MGCTLTLPPEYQQKIDHDIDGIQAHHQNQQIQLINDFAKVKEKFGEDWKDVANEADLKIENIKNRVTEEYTTNQLESVKNYWNGREEDINRARESDKFIDSYLQSSDQPNFDLQSKTKIIRDAFESDNIIQNYLNLTGPCIHEALDCEKTVDDSVTQSDKFIQAYLDGDQIEENKFQEKSKILKDAAESDILLEKYLLELL